jgi:hypothetical protein
VEFENSLLERFLDLAVFIALAVAVGVVGLALLERLTGAEQRVVTLRRAAIPIAIFIALGIAEVLFHLLH